MKLLVYCFWSHKLTHTLILLCCQISFCSPPHMSALCLMLIVSPWHLLQSGILSLQLFECVPAPTPSTVTSRSTVTSTPSNPLSDFLLRPLCAFTNYIYLLMYHIRHFSDKFALLSYWLFSWIIARYDVIVGNICPVMSCWSRQQLLASSCTVQWAWATCWIVHTAVGWKPRPLCCLSNITQYTEFKKC